MVLTGAALHALTGLWDGRHLMALTAATALGKWHLQ